MKQVKTSGHPSQIVNRKMTRSYRVPDSFFLGAKVMKKFRGKWFLGTVDELEADEGTKLWHVTYQDFDGEDLTKKEMAEVLAYHPLLNTTGDLSAPEVGTFAWFSQDNLPRLGQVTSIDPSVSRPVVVQIYEPRKDSVPIYSAKFRAAVVPGTAEPKLARITLHQILLKFENLSAKGFLAAADRKKLRRTLNT